MQIATSLLFFYCTSIVFADFRRTLQSINVWKNKVGNQFCYIPQNGKATFNSTTCVEKIFFPSRAADIARTEEQLKKINDRLNHLTEMMFLNESVLEDALKEEDK
jgi:hypothetical protein